MLCEISEESLMTSSDDYALQNFTANADWFELKQEFLNLVDGDVTTWPPYVTLNHKTRDLRDSRGLYLEQ